MNMPGNESLAIPALKKQPCAPWPKANTAQGFWWDKRSIARWFYLGNVYRMDNKLEDALKAYDTFVNRRSIMGITMWTLWRMRSSRAKGLKLSLTVGGGGWAVAGHLINSTAAELRPVTSRDGSTLFFCAGLNSMTHYDYRKNGDTGVSLWISIL